MDGGKGWNMQGCNLNKIIPQRRDDGGIRRAFDKRYRSVLTRAYDFENREFDLDRLNGIIRVDSLDRKSVV